MSPHILRGSSGALNRWVPLMMKSVQIALLAHLMGLGVPAWNPAQHIGSEWVLMLLLSMYAAASTECLHVCHAEVNRPIGFRFSPKPCATRASKLPGVTHQQQPVLPEIQASTRQCEGANPVKCYDRVIFRPSHACPAPAPIDGESLPSLRSRLHFRSADFECSHRVRSEWEARHHRRAGKCRRVEHQTRHPGTRPSPLPF